MNRNRISYIVLASMLALFAVGCKKKAPPPPPPPPPPAEKPAPAPKPKPVVQSFTAEPSSIQRGQSATLRWTVQGADSVSIDNGIGTVNATGNRQVFPSSGTLYTLTARNASGDTTATARVNVTEPPPPAPTPVAKPKRTLSEALAQEVQDVYFDYDKYDIREDARSVLSRNADALKRILSEFPNASITMEGHCDERGSAEYNLGLGDRRASSAKEFLGQFGLSADRLRPISYGKERPQCMDSNEDCWQKNRRVHFSAGQ
jgi:peptidoglycan-associated lipoprotein